MMTFDPSRPFKKIYDPNKPFDKLLDGFDPRKSFKKIDSKEETLSLIKSEIAKIPTPKPLERVITKETIHEVKVSPKPSKIDSQEVRKAVEKDFQALKDDLEKVKEILPMIGGSGVKGLPNLEKYSISNFTPTRTLDASEYTMNDLANFLGTLIQDLKR